VTLILAAAMLLPSQAQAKEPAAWRWQRCQMKNVVMTGDDWRNREVKLEIRCAVRHWSVPGGVSKALDVARCESGFNEEAVSSTGCSGVYQFTAGTWSSVKERWSKFMKRWSLRGNVFNARSNVLLAIRKAHADGWGAWSCA